MKEIDPLNFLKAVYMNADLPLSVRMRAAIELMPYTYAKLAVVAQVSEQGLAELLDRRLKRVRMMETNARMIEGPRPEPVDVRPSVPITNDRRYRRF